MPRGIVYGFPQKMTPGGRWRPTRSARPDPKRHRGPFCEIKLGQRQPGFATPGLPWVGRREGKTGVSRGVTSPSLYAMPGPIRACHSTQWSGAGNPHGDWDALSRTVTTCGGCSCQKGLRIRRSQVRSLPGVSVPARMMAGRSYR